MTIIASIAVIVTITMVIAVPVALMHPPALLIVIVVRMTPIGPCVWRSLPLTWNPDIPAIPDAPVAISPDIATSGHRGATFITDRRRSRTDVDMNLPKRRDHERR